MNPNSKAEEPDPLLLDAGPATYETFQEEGYLAANDDVRRAVEKGIFASGRDHFDRHGHQELRRLRIAGSGELEARRREKLIRFGDIFRTDLQHERIGLKYDFLTPKLRAAMRIADTDNVAVADYDLVLMPLIREFHDGKILDCGCGKRRRYFSNVLNYEIVDYDTTDVIGVGEILPFKDNSFDGVISNAVLEHVYDPFQCARELIRVVKPGGRIVVSVPFLQPVHGWPHHYFNMTPTGLRSLFERYGMTVTDQQVFPHALPICSLTWIVSSWAKGLDNDATREAFLDLRLRDLMDGYVKFFEAPWVTELSAEKNFELASGTTVFCTKPEKQVLKDLWSRLTSRLPGRNV